MRMCPTGQSLIGFRGFRPILMPYTLAFPRFYAISLQRLLGAAHTGMAIWCHNSPVSHGHSIWEAYSAMANWCVRMVLPAMAIPFGGVYRPWPMGVSEWVPAIVQKVHPFSLTTGVMCSEYSLQHPTTREPPCGP